MLSGLLTLSPFSKFNIIKNSSWIILFRVDISHYPPEQRQYRIDCRNLLKCGVCIHISSDIIGNRIGMTDVVYHVTYRIDYILAFLHIISTTLRIKVFELRSICWAVPRLLAVSSISQYLYLLALLLEKWTWPQKCSTKRLFWLLDLRL